MKPVRDLQSVRAVIKQPSSRAWGVDGLLVVAGHAIYQRGRWHGLAVAGDEPVVQCHVSAGFNLSRRLGFRALALSGGHTRPRLADVTSGAVTNSEADGMYEYALEHRFSAGHADVLLERFARDSFENVLYSLLAYHAKYGTWPRVVAVVSWKFKAPRFYLVAAGLRLPRFRFFGVGDLRDPGLCAWEVWNSGPLIADEKAPRTSRDLIHDPLHRSTEFGAKRQSRTSDRLVDGYIEAVKSAYDIRHNSRQSTVGDLLDFLERVQPGPAWQTIRWPWAETGADES